MFRLAGGDAPPPPLSSSLSPSPPPPLYVDRLVSSYVHPSPPPHPPPYDWWGPSSYSAAAALSTRSAPLGNAADVARHRGSYASVASSLWGSTDGCLGSVSDLGLERPERAWNPSVGRFDRKPSWLTDRPLASHSFSSYGASEYFTPKQVQDASAGSSSSLDCSMFKAGYSVTELENSYRVNRDFISYLQNAEEKYKKLPMDSWNMNIDDDASVNHSLMVNGSSVCSDSTSGNHTELSLDVLLGSTMNAFNSLSSGCGSGEPEKTIPTSSDLRDHHNFPAKSPCWKGVSFSCHFPFGAGDRVDFCPVLKNSEGGSHFDPGEDYLSAGVELESPSSLEHLESSICNDYQEHASGSFAVVSRMRRPKSEDNKTEMSGDVEVSIMQHAHFANAFGEQCDEAREHRDSDSGLKDCNMKHVGQHENISLINEPLLLGEVTNPQIGPKVAAQAKYSQPGKDIQLLVRTMLGLSEVLLCNLFGDINNLKEQDRELIQLVINNLKALNDRDKKAEVSNVDNGINFSDNFVPGGVDANSRECVTQALDMALKENYVKPEEYSQVLLYKKLWLEAEVALSSMKYELQCAHMKLEVQKNKHERKANLDESSDVEQKPSQVNKLLSLNSMDDIDQFAEPSCEGNQSLCANTESHEVNRNKADVDASVLARFRDKNEWTDNWNSTTMEEHVKLHADNWNSITMEEHAKFLDSTEVESCLGAGQTTHGPHLDGKKLQESVFLPSSHASSGFSHWKPQPCTDTEHDSRISELERKSSVQQQNEQSAKDRECRTATEYPLCIADEPVGLPCISSIHGSEAFSCGSDGQLSEWEHVTEEEITWYNSSKTEN